MEIRSISFLQARSIRREVLRPGGPESEIAYPGDAGESARHFGAFEGDKLTGVATFLPEPCPDGQGTGAWRLRGMATIRAAQGRGVGGQLLRHGIGLALTQGVAVIWCYGRTTARAFYERHGFKPVGDEFALPKSGPHYLFVRRAG
jgi:GNAT superfamily N-acetyltransferase